MCVTYSSIKRNVAHTSRKEKVINLWYLSNDHLPSDIICPIEFLTNSITISLPITLRSTFGNPSRAPLDDRQSSCLIFVQYFGWKYAHFQFFSKMPSGFCLLPILRDCFLVFTGTPDLCIAPVLNLLIIIYVLLITSCIC